MYIKLPQYGYSSICTISVRNSKSTGVLQILELKLTFVNSTQRKNIHNKQFEFHYILRYRFEIKLVTFKS